MSAPKPTGYSLAQIVLHWLIAAIVIFQVVFGESMEAYYDSAFDGEAATPSDVLLGQGHYWLGIAVLVLVAIRIALRLSHGVPAPVPMPAWQARAAEALHGLFYVMLVVVPVMGLLAWYVGDPFGDLHRLSKPAFVILVALHAVAALHHQFIKRDGTLLRMLRPS